MSIVELLNHTDSTIVKGVAGAIAGAAWGVFVLLMLTLGNKKGQGDRFPMWLSTTLVLLSAAVLAWWTITGPEPWAAYLG